MMNSLWHMTLELPEYLFLLYAVKFYALVNCAKQMEFLFRYVYYVVFAILLIMKANLKNITKAMLIICIRDLYI